MDAEYIKLCDKRLSHNVKNLIIKKYEDTHCGCCGTPFNTMRYIFSNEINRFVRKCCNKTYPILLDEEKEDIWPVMDKEVDKLCQKFTTFSPHDCQTINDILYNPRGTLVTKWMTSYNHCFQEVMLGHDQEVYIYIAWQLYKAYQNKVDDNRITSCTRVAKYLERFFIPFNSFKLCKW